MGRTATERLEDLADSLHLTGKQRQFGLIRVTEPTKPQTTAAREAGYAPGSAHVKASETVRLGKVKTFMDAARRELTANRPSIADPAEILRFHTSVMRGNMDDFVSRDEATGKLVVDPSKVTRRKARLIKEITLGRDGEVKGIKLQSAQVSADRLARHFGLYDESDSSRHLQTALTLGALVGSLPEQERSDLARRLMGPVIDVASTEVPADVDVTPKASDR